MADVRRTNRTNRIDKSKAKKNGAATRKPRVKTLATLEPSDLRSVSLIYGLLEQKQVELASLQNHYKLVIEEIRDKYSIAGQFDLNFETGKVTATGSG